MTRKPLKQLLGFYIPSFVTIHCTTNCDSNQLLKSDKDMSVLSHEYIHFLQDVSTSYGLLNLSNYYNCTRNASSQIHTASSDEIELPIKITSDILLSAIRACNIVDPYNQCFEKEYLSNLNLRLESEPPITIEGTEFSIYLLIDTSGSFRYQLGARDILESMAYIIERFLFGDQIPAPMLPYRSANVIVNSMYPELAHNEKVISGLCEIALCSSHPIEMFIITISLLKKAEFLPDTYEQLIEFLFNGLRFHSFDGKLPYTFNEAVTYSFDKACEHIGEFLKAPQFDSLLQWSKNVLCSAHAKRVDDPVFITRSLMDVNGKRNLNAFMISQIGIPVIINGCNEAFTYDQREFSDQLLLFPAMAQVTEQLLDQDASGCGLFPVCKKIVEDGLAIYHTSFACHDSPWIKVSEKDLCPFALIWHSWGFGTKRYKKCI